MKSVLISLSLTLLSIQYAKACPVFSGDYLCTETESNLPEEELGESEVFEMQMLQTNPGEYLYDSFFASNLIYGQPIQVPLEEELQLGSKSAKVKASCDGNKVNIQSEQYEDEKLQYSLQHSLEYKNENNLVVTTQITTPETPENSVLQILDCVKE